MCGIVGILNRTTSNSINEMSLRKMLAMIRHRGPDQFGIYLNHQVGLGSARLSIIDVDGGQQPITNETKDLWIVFNGEIYNYPDLRAELENRGHEFRTQSDTEVILHLYEEEGPHCLTRLNGQFAIAIWNNKNGQLFLARDRMGIRPLFYTQHEGRFIFGSEMKTIFVNQRIRAEIDPISLNQIFTYWSTLSPRTIFKDVFEVPPGHYLIVDKEHLHIEQYYELGFPDAVEWDSIIPLRSQGGIDWPSQQDFLDTFQLLLVSATNIRLRADVPVGAYLSGGIDSSTISAIIRFFSGCHLDTFSIAFSDSEFDESEYQQRIATFLGTEHHVVRATHADIGEAFPDVIWHVETPIMRTSPVPLFLLSKLVHEQGYKVVLTGEGADEILAGYNIFKEAKVRRFWARFPDSSIRPRLLEQLYPYIADLRKGGSTYLSAFFRKGLEDVNGNAYSHAIRWGNNQRAARFFSKAIQRLIEQEHISITKDIEFPSGFLNWDPLSRAQYLELTIFMSQYLLSSQGDRVAMAHSVEGRFPFLDHRVVEFCNYLPPEQKLFGLSEKRLLKMLARQWLPDEIWQRSKKPYRAPIHRSFFHDQSPGYVEELLSPRIVKNAGLFDAQRVGNMVKKVKASQRLSETDDMALAGILSTQLVHDIFVSNLRSKPPISESEDVKVYLQEKVH